MKRSAVHPNLRAVRILIIPARVHPRPRVGFFMPARFICRLVLFGSIEYSNKRQATSIRVSPCLSAVSIFGKSGPNQRSNAPLRVFPRRNHTTAGPVSSSVRRSAKSSSLVTMTAPVSVARSQMRWSSAPARPRSNTWTASCPCPACQRASAGGSCASIRNRTRKLVMVQTKLIS